MTTHQLSSGDMTADKRADYARMFAENGDHAAAADLMRQTMDLVPEWAAGWFSLGDYAERAGDRDTAIAAYSRVLQLSPDDMFGAWLKLSYLGAGPKNVQPPSLYVEHLFDDYADSFDVSLVEKLDYHVPELLAELIRKNMPPSHRFQHVADLGCGTGLFAEAFAGSFQTMEGADISQNMLNKARDKQVYSRLLKVDLALPPDRSGLFSNELKPHRADLVTATDVFIYIGNLQTTFANIAHLICEGGVLAFSVEETAEDEGVHLGSSLRFAHSKNYLCQLCEDHGFTILSMEPAMIRMDAGQPVWGLLVLCKVLLKAAL